MESRFCSICVWKTYHAHQDKQRRGNSSKIIFVITFCLRKFAVTLVTLEGKKAPAFNILICKIQTDTTFY